MTNDNQCTLQRLRLWRQIETLVNELQDLIYDWYDNDPTIEEFYNRLSRNPPYHHQLLLPFFSNDYSPNPVQKTCPLCQIRRWP
jgi:hypothetical protein